MMKYGVRDEAARRLCAHGALYCTLEFTQVAQLSQRDRAAGWVSYRQKWKTGTGRQ